jgi:hypothetical protein
MKILVITNENRPGSAPGQRDALLDLVSLRWISSVKFVSHKIGQDYSNKFKDILDEVSAKSYDVLIVWSPKNFPSNQKEFEQLKKGIGSRPVLYWEGDTWGEFSLKPFFEQMFWWASISTILFTVSGNPQKEIFSQYCQNVVLIPHTYCHIQFKKEASVMPYRIFPESKIVMVGNQSATIPFIYGMPGSGTRFAMAALMKYSHKQRFQIYGLNWPRWLGAYPIDYKFQAKVVRDSIFSVNWDNFPSHESYASDRTPIALLAGRIFITTKHPGISLYGDEDNGLFQFESPFKILEASHEFISSDPEFVYRAGLNAHNWVKKRLSHREAGRFIVSKLTKKVPPLNLYPWNSI